MASISVLSITSAQTHSLLNVGKRITNVIAAAIFFGIQLETSGYLGLVIAMFGGAVYAGAFKTMAAKHYAQLVLLSQFAKGKHSRKQLFVFVK